MVFLNVRKCRKLSGCNFVGNAVCVSYYGFDFLSARLSIEMHWLISFIVLLRFVHLYDVFCYGERQMSESRPPFNKHVHQAWVLNLFCSCLSGFVEAERCLRSSRYQFWAGSHKLSTKCYLLYKLRRRRKSYNPRFAIFDNW